MNYIRLRNHIPDYFSAEKPCNTRTGVEKNGSKILHKCQEVIPVES